jgi:hypothetical protein
MVRLEDLVAYVGTTAAITAAVAVSLCASGPSRPRDQAPAASDAKPVRLGVMRRALEMPEEYKRELATGIAACFDPLNPPSQDMIDEVNALYLFGDRYNVGSRWTTTASGTTGSQGDAATLLWSFVPDGLSIPNGVGEGVGNSDLFARMDSLFASVGGRTAWIQAFVRSFQRWEALSGVNYSRVTVGGNDWDDGASWSSSGLIGSRGDVRISMKNIDGGSGILAYNSFPGGGVGGNMVIDRSETWQSGSTGNTPFRFLRNTIMHEHGHGLGFNHTCSTNSGILMEPFLSTSFDGPQQDDIRAVQRSYGDPFEPNNNAGQAVLVGTLGTSGTTTIGTIPTTVPGDTIIYPTPANSSLVSIDANGENDFWSVNTTANVLVNLTLTPIGSTYDDSDQLGGGSCDTGNDINAAAIANLSLRVTNNTGVTTLGFVNDTASGTAESIPSFLLSGGSTYLLNVAEADAPAQSQLYRVTIQVAAATTMTASDATLPTTINLSWTSIPGATGYQVFRSTSNDFATAVEIAAPVTNSFADAGLPNGAIRFYWVKATQSVGGFTNNQFVGGPEQGSTSSPSNNAPTANAGADQSVRDPEGDGVQAVTLNGSGSTDSDGTITNYTWRDGATVVATGVNPPVPFAANAGGDQIVTDTDNSGSEDVVLSAAGSSDSDGSIVTYTWREGATVIASGINPSVSLPVGVHTLDLTVTDNEGRTGTDSVTITVEEGSTACPADFNGDGFLDFFDYDDFVNCYENGVCPPGQTADYNGDGFVDFFDYDDFVNAYESGC